MTIAGRVKILLTIVNAFNKLVDIERIAWNLDEVDDTRSYEDVLAEVYGKALNDRTVATHTAKLISNSQRDD